MRIHHLAPVILMVLTLVGCGGRNQKAEATRDWNAARARVLASLAQDQFRAGSFDKCQGTVDEGLKLDPTSAQLFVLNAKLAMERNQLERAEQSLTLARQYNPRDAEVDYLMGVIYQRWQKNEAALGYYQSACEKAPAEIAYLLARAETLVTMDRQAEAITLLQDKVLYFEHSAVIRDALGQLLVETKRYDEAVAVLKEASILATDELTIREHLAFAQYYARQYNDSAENLRRLLKEPTYAKRGDLYLTLGECQMQAGKFRDARGSFESASQLQPGSPHAWRQLAKAALKTGDLQRADTSLRKALHLDNTSFDTHLLTGYLRLKQSRYDDALASFKKANTLQPSDTVSLCMIGYSFSQKGQHEQAASYYAKALRQKPGDPLASRLMANVDLSE